MNFNINFLTSVSESEGFGINTDLFDTNVLNLTVVIAVLVYYGRSLLSDLIKSRKEMVLKNLQEADNKFREASENLALAKKQFENSKLKAEQIRSQGLVLASQASQKLIEAIDDDIKRMKDSTLATIRFEEEKSIAEVCSKLNYLAFSKAVDKLKKRLNSNLQKKIISQNIDRLSYKSLGYK